ncbi:methyl-accepting chemotaxis protein [Paenibacillus sp. sgz302251]|uniref:methyl-accepting chemotaxis protein n=1 Tax=Paenibacillus sp. sgz302251 TaxID=3414493 RepID=UPI003C7CCCE7
MRNLSISKKLLAGFLAVLILLVVIILTNLIQIISINRTYSELIDNRVAKMLHIKDMTNAMKSQQAALRGYALFGDGTALATIEYSHERVQSISAELAPTFQSSNMQELLKQIDQREAEFYQFSQEIISLKNQNMMSQVNSLLANEGREMVTLFEAVATAMESYQQEQLDTGIIEVENQVQQVMRVVIILGILSILLGVGIALFMGRLISKPVVAVAKAAERIASGDLTGEKIIIKNNDEIGKMASSFNMMTANLRSLIIQVGTNAEQVAASSEELTASAEQTSTATEQIAKTMQEVASGVDIQVKLVSDGFQTINEMSVGFQQIAENTQNVSFKAAEASEKAMLGNESIKTAVEQMNAINETVNGLSEIVKELGGQSAEISQIVEVIGELSAQTNLLSLNAAIEAARAGEHGRGFEVVATEVRKLSTQSADSAQKISSLISAIQAGMGKATQSMDAVTREVHSGIGIVHSAGQSFDYIQSAVSDVAAGSQEVSASVQQMTAGVDEMSGSMKTISETTESSAAGTEQVSAATQEQLSSMEEISAAASALSKMAEDLQQNISRFKVN